MGTRGAFGFRLNGADRSTYNHMDSYPDCLGLDIAKFIAHGIERAGYTGFIGETKQRVAGLVAVDSDTPPTEQQKAWLKPYARLDVGEQSTDDWYCLLRETQGDPDKMLAAKFYAPSNEFVHDSLFCEYAYVINLDDETLEFYVGFQPANDLPAKIGTGGRYRETPPDKENDPKYGSVSLVATFPLASFSIPGVPADKRADDIVAAMNAAAESDAE